jgi:integrase/recombinase XerD
LRFCPVVVSANGRVKPDYVLVADRQERHPEGAYYLEWYDGGRRVRRSVGKDAGTAAARRHQQEQILASKAAGIRLAEEGESNGPLLGDAVATYLDEIRKTKKHKTWSAYKAALSYFLDSCGKARVSEIDRSDLLQFSAFLRDTKKLQPRTVYNKFESVMSFLKATACAAWSARTIGPATLKMSRRFTSALISNGSLLPATKKSACGLSFS